jgi:uncharacterized membrane protein YfcA
MISRLIVAICSVAASVGLLLVGMATSYATRDHDMFRLGLILMIGGAAGTVIGALWYRAEEAAATRQMATREAPASAPRR